MAAVPNKDANLIHRLDNAYHPLQILLSLLLNLRLCQTLQMHLKVLQRDAFSLPRTPSPLSSLTE